MRPQYKSAGAILVVALLWGGASAAVFVVIGSELAVYSLGAMLPVLAIIGFLYVRGGSGSTSEQRIQEQRAREVGSRFVDVYGEYRSMQETYPDLMADVDPPFEQVIKELERQNISVDRETGTTSLDRFGSPDVTTLASIENDIDDLESRLEEAFVEKARAEIKHVTAQLRRLEGIVQLTVDQAPGEIPDPDEAEPDDGGSWWRTVGRNVESHREQAHEELERAADELRESTQQTADVDKTAVEKHLSKAESAGSIEQSVEAVLAARDTLREEASGSFNDRRRELLALAEAVQSTDIDEYLDSTRINEFETAVEDVRSIDDAIEMTELRNRGSQLRTVCTDVVRDLEETLRADLETLTETGVPDVYYDRPDAAERNYASEIRSVSGLEAYRSEWRDAAADLIDALDTISRKARVASMYAEIEEHIKSTLRRDGEITGEDLPVKRDYEQFLILYAMSHDVRFDQSVPKVSVPEGGERYTATVGVSFEEEGEKRTASVRLGGPEYEETATVRTDDSGVVEFEDVPYGEYTIEAIPRNDSNRSAETTVMLDENVEVDLKMANVTLRERFCTGHDDAKVETYLEELSGRFADSFEANGYLTTETDFPIADRYVPCLLATWAGDAGYRVTETDGQVLVFDVDMVRNELEMVAQHNLGAGESMDYATLRERFLSAPIPDGAVRNVAAEIENVTATEERIERQDA